MGRVSTPYSRSPEAIASTRAFLMSVRERSEDDLPRYGEVAQLYGGIARAVAPVLNAVARDCAEAGEPDLSALVVLSDTGLPGRLKGQVVDPQDPRAHAAWCSELARIRAFEWPGSQEALQGGLSAPHQMHQAVSQGRLIRR